MDKISIEKLEKIMLSDFNALSRATGITMKQFTKDEMIRRFAESIHEAYENSTD